MKYLPLLLFLLGTHVTLEAAGKKDEGAQKKPENPDTNVWLTRKAAAAKRRSASESDPKSGDKACAAAAVPLTEKKEPQKDDSDTEVTETKPEPILVKPAANRDALIERYGESLLISFQQLNKAYNAVMENEVMQSNAVAGSTERYVPVEWSLHETTPTTHLDLAFTSKSPTSSSRQIEAALNHLRDRINYHHQVNLLDDNTEELSLLLKKLSVLQQVMLTQEDRVIDSPADERLCLDEGFAHLNQLLTTYFDASPLTATFFNNHEERFLKEFDAKVRAENIPPDQSTAGKAAIILTINDLRKKDTVFKDANEQLKNTIFTIIKTRLTENYKPTDDGSRNTISTRNINQLLQNLTLPVSDLLRIYSHLIPATFCFTLNNEDGTPKTMSPKEFVQQVNVLRLNSFLTVADLKKQKSTLKMTPGTSKWYNRKAQDIVSEGHGINYLTDPRTHLPLSISDTPGKEGYTGLHNSIISDLPEPLADIDRSLQLARELARTAYQEALKNPENIENLVAAARKLEILDLQRDALKNIITLVNQQTGLSTGTLSGKSKFFSSLASAASYASSFVSATKSDSSASAHNMFTQTVMDQAEHLAIARHKKFLVMKELVERNLQPKEFGLDQQELQGSYNKEDEAYEFPLHMHYQTLKECVELQKPNASDLARRYLPLIKETATPSRALSLGASAAAAAK